MVVPVPEIGYNSDSEQYRSGYAHFKNFCLKTLTLITGFWALGGNSATFFSGTMIIVVVLLLVAVFFIRIKQ